MDHYEFKIGDLVRGVSNDPDDIHYKNKIGKIIHIDSLNVYTIEFFKPVKYGHSGSKGGKDGFCRYSNKRKIKLYQPVLKLFLKEKENENI